MVVKLLITIVLLRIFWTDLRSRKIGKVDTLLLIILGTGGQTFRMTDALVGGGVCAAIPELVNLIFSNLRGLGGGDIRLMFAAGWLLGTDRGLYALLAGGTVALAASGLYSIQKKKRAVQLSVPFGPFLALGIMLMLWTV